MVLEMLFLIFSNVNIFFSEQELISKFYTIVEALFITKQAKLINKKKFDKAMFNKNSKTLVIHLMILKALLVEMLIYLYRKFQIASLLTKKGMILDKYSDFKVIFFEKRALVLLEQTNLNKHGIEL